MVEPWAVTVLIGMAIVVGGIYILINHPLDPHGTTDLWIGIVAIIGGGALSGVSLYSKAT